MFFHLGARSTVRIRGRAFDTHQGVRAERMLTYGTHGSTLYNHVTIFPLLSEGWESGVI